MDNNGEICEGCNRLINSCICSVECSHICSLDYGELYCPICFPDKRKAND